MAHWVPRGLIVSRIGGGSGSRFKWGSAATTEGHPHPLAPRLHRSCAILFRSHWCPNASADLSGILSWLGRSVRPLPDN
jgi:hypothetical protein